MRGLGFWAFTLLIPALQPLFSTPGARSSRWNIIWRFGHRALFQ